MDDVRQSTTTERRNHAACVAALLEETDCVRVTMGGSSMLPTLPERAAVELHRVEPALLRPGDLIAYRSGTKVVAHRFLRLRSPEGSAAHLIARGDGSPRLDRPIAARDLLGRIESIEIHGRWCLAETLREPLSSRLVGKALLAAERARGVLPRWLLRVVGVPARGTLAAILWCGGGRSVRQRPRSEAAPIS